MVAQVPEHVLSQPRRANMAAPEIVCLTKSNGPLTKEIRLEDGVLRSDGSACIMARGTARRVQIAGVVQLAALINGLRSDQAIALGSLRPDLPDEIRVVTKREINGATRPDIISRSADYIIFNNGQCGFVLLDFDTKGMPADVAERLAGAGGFWPALLSVIPELDRIARVARASTSAGLYNRETGAPVPGSNGEHIYLLVRDVADSARFLKALHDRCWLAGYGWFVVSVSGQLLERSIVDRMVGGPERLVFEGPPILVGPLAQGVEARRPRVTEGDELDTLAACPPLTIVGNAKVQELRIKAKLALIGKAVEAREKYIAQKAGELADRTGVSPLVARETISKQCNGELLPSLVLPFDDPELAGKTVADVLADPAAFVGETLADPLEGIEYGPCKAKVIRRADGTLFINSFAHGGTIYELKFDAAAVRAAMSKAPADEVVALLVDMLLRAAVSPTEEAALNRYARDLSGTGTRDISRQIKLAREEKAEKDAEEARECRMAERNDQRPCLPAPAYDAPWLPEMGAYNEVLGKSTDRIPPARNIGSEMAMARRLAVPNLHAFSSTNQEDEW
jgi:hypothetical protein